MQTGFTRWGIGGLAMIIAAILFSIVAAWRITKSIYAPIKKLHDVTTTIARRDLETLVTTDNADEITELGMSFNVMVGKIKELLDAKITEHENLKKAELRALQAQINPHFLYNTLDAIIWMAEARKTDKVVELVHELSRFFRISLSKGRDWITVREEVEHVVSYLAIQKMRYRDILDFKVEVPDNLFDGQILKLTLQPLVENALYHGIKNKRNGGTITVRGRRLEGDLLQIRIEDDGIGMTQERLAEIRALLDIDIDAANEVTGEGGYGVNNVNQRIKLYYGQAYGLTIESEYMHGTSVSVVIPMQRAPAFREALALGAC
jgi:two-component system sensor histidine kinase YesM